MENMYECLKIDNQLCFPLYAAAKEVTRAYKEYLEPLDLTYTQYITMMLLWEKKEITSKELGQKLFLDSGTLSPVLKKLEIKGYISRNRLLNDERNLILKITKSGLLLQEKAKDIPFEMMKKINLTIEEAESLYKILYKILS